MSIASTVSSLDLLSTADTPTRVTFRMADEGEGQITSTVGGDYALRSEAEEDDAERRAWAKLVRRARVQRAKEDPF